MRQKGDLITDQFIDLIFDIELSNQRKVRACHCDNYIIDDIWGWSKVKVTSKQGRLIKGRFWPDEKKIKANNGLILVHLEIRHRRKTYQETFQIKFPYLISYKLESDSLQPYHFVDYSILGHFSNGTTLAFKAHDQPYSIRDEQIILSDTDQLEFTDKGVNYVPKSSNSKKYVLLHSYREAKKSTDTFYILQLQQLNLTFNGSHGSSGYSGSDGGYGYDCEDGDDGDDGSSATAGQHGPEVELFIRVVKDNYEILLFEDDQVYQYFIGLNAKVDLDARGGTGGSGGDGGDGGDGGSSRDDDHDDGECSSGDDGCGGDGGDGGNGGNGGQVAVYTDLKLSLIANLLDVDVRGGSSGFGGTGGSGYISGSSGDSGISGKQGHLSINLISSSVLDNYYASYNE